MYKLNKGDKVAIVSLSSGVLGEVFCSHQLKIGTKRLEEFGLIPVFMKNSLKGMQYIKENPDKRCEDLIEAFADSEIKGIICAIGGDDTYKIAKYLFTQENMEIIKKNPKVFIGYSDSTINHFMLNKIGVNSFYGLSFLTCFAELDNEMLAYSKESFLNLFNQDKMIYRPSKIWYEERESFSEENIGKSRISHIENKGYELLKGSPKFSGDLIGGCIESIHDMIKGVRYDDKTLVNREFGLINSADFENKLVFLETSELKPNPEELKSMLITLRDFGLFNNICGIIIGKPQNEKYYEEYKKVYLDVFENDDISIGYNFNFGHAYPKMIMQYGAKAYIDISEQEVIIERI